MSMASTRGDRRRRFAKACDPCRRRKLRCDSVRPVCTRCHDLNASCHYTDINKPYTRQRRSQDLVQTSSGSLLEDQDSIARISTDTPVSRSCPSAAGDVSTNQGSTRPSQTLGVESAVRRVDRASISTPSQIRGAPIAETPNSGAYSVDSDTIVGGSADTRFFGPSSLISLASIGTTSQPPDHPSRPSVQPSLQEGSWSAWTHPSIQSMLEKRINTPLPPWTKAFSLVSEFFDEEHKAFPCFHPPTFMALLGQQYSGTSIDSPAWWASLNAVLAIAQRRRVEKGQCPATDDDQAWGYAANALGTALDILMRNTQLISVQALLSIAWFFLGTPNPQPSFMFTGSALRLAHSIGLHKIDCNPSSGPIEHQMRTNVFWIALNLDRELCLRTGRPAAHDLHDFQVSLPGSTPGDDSETITTADGSTMKLLRAQAQLALIQSCIYRELYSSGSSKDASSIADSVPMLNQQLEEWCATFTPAFYTDRPPQKSEHHGLIRLYYSYYNCVMVVNCAHGREFWKPLNFAIPPDLSASMNASVERCLNAARSIVALIHTVDRKWKSFYWDTIPIIFSAAIILSINVLRKPHLDTAKDDLQTVSEIVQLFAALYEEKTGTYLLQVRRLCEELYRLARQALQSFEGQSSLPSQQRGWDGETPIRQTRQNNLVGANSMVGLTISNNDHMPIFHQVDGGESAFRTDSRLNGNEFDLGGWLQSGQDLPYPISAQWSFDNLSGGPFMPLY